MEIIRLNAPVGAEIRGLDLSKALSSTTVSTIRQAWWDNPVLLFRGQDLDEAEVHATLERGLRVTALELHYQLTDDAAVSFVLDEEGVVRRLRLPEAEDDTLAEDAAAALDANLALLAPTLGQLVDALLPALGGLQKDDADG